MTLSGMKSDNIRNSFRLMNKDSMEKGKKPNWPDWVSAVKDGGPDSIWSIPILGIRTGELPQLKPKLQKDEIREERISD